MASVPIAPSDLTWLNMDRPTNLMVVNGLMWFDAEPDWDAVKAVVQERLIDRYAVLSRRPVHEGGTWAWVDDPGFDLDRHLQRVTLPAPGDQATVQRYVSERFSQPLDRGRPLWEIDLISGYARGDGAPGAAVLARFHHSLADGIRLVQLILGLCDATEEATPPVVGRDGAGAGPLAIAGAVGRQVVSDVASFVGDLASSAAGAIPSAASSAAAMTHAVLHDGVGLVLRPTRITDAVTGLADEDNASVNTLRSAARLTLWGQDARLVADLAPGVEKRVSWIDGLDLDTIKAIGKDHEATVNDVLLSVVAAGLTRYLEERGRSGADEANFLVPVSLKPVDASLPTELGNHFAMVMFPLPLGIDDHGELLREVSSRMARIKNSAEAMMVFGAQRAVAETPGPVAEWITGFVADKTVGLLTNVPGPRAPIALAGTTVAGILGWVPTASDQNLGLCILSYAGSVSIGVSADAGIMPDPERLADQIVAALDRMAADRGSPAGGTDVPVS